jgi:hypothetical protein
MLEALRWERSQGAGFGICYISGWVDGSHSASRGSRMKDRKQAWTYADGQIVTGITDLEACETITVNKCRHQSVTVIPRLL